MTPERESRLREIYGSHFDGASAEVLEARLRCQRLLRLLNASSPEEVELRREIFQNLFGGWSATVHIEPPFFCDCGFNIFLGEGTYLNFNCTILDTERVTIGKRCWIAPNVQIYAATHPVDAVERRERCLAKPVTVGDDVWLGGGVILCPGVTIGDRTVIGAGSVVTRDIPSDSVAFGNPCRVHRTLNRETAK